MHTDDEREKEWVRGQIDWWMRDWLPRLRHFRLCIKVGGLANDVDELVAVIRWPPLSDMETVENILGDSGAHVMERPGALEIAFANGWDDLTHTEFERAAALERVLPPSVSFVDPPRQGSRCVCPQNYPDLFAG